MYIKACRTRKGTRREGGEINCYSPSLQMTAAYTSAMTDAKPNKKKQLHDPAIGK